MISRRKFLELATASTATMVGFGSQSSNLELPSILQLGPIKGIDIATPQGWEMPPYGITPSRANALHKAGFNTARIFLPYGLLMRNMGRYEVSFLVHQVSLAVQAGFRTLISWESSVDERKKTLLDDALREVVTSNMAQFSSILADRFSPQAICLELMNEPPTKHGDYAVEAFHRVRRCFTTLTVVVQSPDYAFYGSLAKLPVKEFDQNTLFSFHPYEPGEFTHQGINYPNFPRLPWPISDYEGGLGSALMHMAASVTQNGSLSTSEKVKRVHDYSGVLRYLFSEFGSGRSDIERRWVAAIEPWLNDNSLRPERILVGEFGVSGNFNYTGGLGADLLYRAKFMRDVRAIAEDLGFGGWIAHQAIGDFNLFQLDSNGKFQDGLISELLSALFD